MKKARKKYFTQNYGKVLLNIKKELQITRILFDQILENPKKVYEWKWKKNLNLKLLIIGQPVSFEAGVRLKSKWTVNAFSVQSANLGPRGGEVTHAGETGGHSPFLYPLFINPRSYPFFSLANFMQIFFLILHFSFFIPHHLIQIFSFLILIYRLNNYPLFLVVSLISIFISLLIFLILYSLNLSFPYSWFFLPNIFKPRSLFLTVWLFIHFLCFFFSFLLLNSLFLFIPYCVCN